MRRDLGPVFIVVGNTLVPGRTEEEARDRYRQCRQFMARPPKERERLRLRERLMLSMTRVAAPPAPSLMRSARTARPRARRPRTTRSHGPPGRSSDDDPHELAALAAGGRA